MYWCMSNVKFGIWLQSAAVNIMDDDLREQLHMDLAPCTDQEFFDAYCKLHLETFGEEFEPNQENPAW